LAHPENSSLPAVVLQNCLRGIQEFEPKRGITMPEDNGDGLEFSDEQLRAVLKRVGQDARQKAFAAGRPVFIVKGTSLVALHADGTEEVIECLGSETESGQDHE
jgi:hypothetical protein